MSLDKRTNIFQLEPYWRRYVNRITDLKQQLKVAEAMGNHASARNITQEIESIERHLIPKHETNEENRWDWTMNDGKPQVKMNTQGL